MDGRFVGYRLGVDTGGTYTDVVLVDSDHTIKRSAKALTTHKELIVGLRNALEQASVNEYAAQVELVCLSTTLATNALVEGRGRRVGLILVGFTEAQMQRANLKQALAGDPHVMLAGGHLACGTAQAALDVEGLNRFLADVDQHVDAYAISALFAPRNPEHEKQVQAVIEATSGKPVSCGHQLSSALDAPRRALTALLNARLIPLIDSLLVATQTLLAQKQIQAPLMVVKGDGSLITAAVARQCPVETILSGPAASVIGAQFLCTEATVLVSDMGGTTTDVALIEQGQPKLSTEGAVVGGWRTMVKAIDIRSYGLGGDSSVVFDTTDRQFKIGPGRVVPLSLLAVEHPEIVPVLEEQWALPMSTTHSGQFALVHAAAPIDLSPQQQELFDRIKHKPIALQTLFKDQTLARALQRLEQRGVIIRSGFTPTDACHVLNLCKDGNAEASELGAKLLARFSGSNLGVSYADAHGVSSAICEQVSQLAAMAMLDSLSASRGQPLSRSQHELLKRSLDSQSDNLIVLTPSLQVPVIGLGAPVASFYPACGRLLNTPVILPEHGDVANALGAVVGSVRQEQVILITPSSGKKVRVMLPDGPQVVDSLEAGAALASEVATTLSVAKAHKAGSIDVAVVVERADKIVEQGGQSVFFESRITAIASGRPAVAQDQT